MEKQYNVFVQWHENTNNYKRFDGGVQMVSRRNYGGVKYANQFAADWLYNYNDNFSYDLPYLYADNRGGEIAINLNSPEPASYDFGDGTIYVAEVVE